MILPKYGLAKNCTNKKTLSVITHKLWYQKFRQSLVLREAAAEALLPDFGISVS